MQAIYYRSARSLVQAMKQKELSAVEVMTAFLDRIDKVNPLINGLGQTFPREECLKQARSLDQKEPKGPLHGLPFTVKDNLLVKGLTSCVGCEGLKDKVAEEDSTVVSRLKNAGALAIGITNVPEFLASYETDNLVYGRTNNPYDLSKTPGGSSGGCAALVAAGCTPLSISSDAAGSIRWPSHCSGVAGHKPTLGLIPRTGSPMGHARGLIGQFAVVGPLARYVEDLILTLPLLAGSDGIDPYNPPVPLKSTNVDLRTLKVSYCLDDGLTNTSSDIVECIETLACELQGELVELPFLKDSYQLLWRNFYLGADQGAGFKSNLQFLGVKTPSPLLQEFMEQAATSSLTVTQFRNVFRDMDLFRFKMLTLLKDYDILLTPVAATTAKAHGTTHKESQDMTFSMVHSITGWPVTTVRCGTSKEGLPIGVQIAAKPWNDHLSLAMGAHIESLTGGWRPPSI